MRKLSAKFMDDLVNPKGVLHPILARVKKDQTLMLAIREDFINIYYRGGNILNIKEHSKGFYQASFDDQYNESGLHIPDSPAEINHQNDARSWIDSFPIMFIFCNNTCSKLRLRTKQGGVLASDSSPELTHFFPSTNFLFGVTNVPYLCEGGYNGPNKIKNSYPIMELRGNFERSGDTSRFWTNLEEQILLTASLGLNAFWMGIDWSRIQPTSLLPVE
jgi:hypothetical protein